MRTYRKQRRGSRLKNRLLKEKEFKNMQIWEIHLKLFNLIKMDGNGTTQGESLSFNKISLILL